MPFDSKSEEQTRTLDFVLLDARAIGLSGVCDAEGFDEMGRGA
jgi:hypothetical protein